MKRDHNKIDSTSFDLIIIGGGITGAFAAWDAALRGLDVVLVEKGDFGAATSANSLRLVHGGLRYLQQADIRRMRQSIYERQNDVQTIRNALLANSPAVRVERSISRLDALLRRLAPRQTRYKVTERPDVRTVRYYTSHGLLPKPDGYEGGRARYSGRHLARLLPGAKKIL